mmetsp:Transcript_30132/g.45945  ORF Transcript_30132/g.45945 Transcript_30132/m.45945 type:complete len:1293 (-) Transcript_30132:1715-5593(-)|eukprot:CAMPEP_0194229662 /NCGR_PEP_ID=MMETSP0156-20130528/44006_1 /TAXON_ID=33649 /ORGANISM="Thalassionema nitzschioides, Strain L26-B" /LENGTH=1292 /DNA_ID=CAMNT_0038962221 /DNA_START=199 /DNA_END=4077 /DNA_ORIENTATION=-
MGTSSSQEVQSTLPRSLLRGEREFIARGGEEEEFHPILSQDYEWMGRSVETLILGCELPTSMLAIEDDIDGISTRISNARISARLNNPIHESSTARRNAASSHSQDSSNGPNVCLSLLAREITGRNSRPNETAARRLRNMGGATLLQRVDNPAGGIVSELALLERALQQGDWSELCHLVSGLTPRLVGDPSLQRTSTANSGRLSIERQAFIIGGGVELYLRIFRDTARDDNHSTTETQEQEQRWIDARDLSPSLVANKLANCWNEVLASLRELVYALPVLVENQSIFDHGRFVPFLFTLLSHEVCFDTAATLIEEILSLQSHSPPPPIPSDEAQIDSEYRSMTLVVPVTTFFLGNIPNLYSLWRGFNCRQLAHFCRILALLVFEPEDRQLLESPAVLKSLGLLQLRRDRAVRRDATVDMNQAILLGDAKVMGRLISLLKVMNYAPTLRRSAAYHVMAHFPFISETLMMLGLSEMSHWTDLGRLDALARKLLNGNNNLSELGSVTEMLEQLSGSLQSNSSLEPTTQLGHIIHVINAAQQAGVVVGRRRPSRSSSIHVASMPLSSNADASSQSPQQQQQPSLDNIASAAITISDQVMMRRNSAPTPNTTNNNNDDDNTFNSNNLLLTIDMTGTGDNVSSPSPASSYNGRLRISSPEDAANELQFNALLLAPYQVEVLFVLCTLLGGRRKMDTQRFLQDAGLISTMNDMFHRLSFGTTVSETANPSDASTTTADTAAAAAESSPSTTRESEAGSEDTSALPAAGSENANGTGGGIHGPGCECTPESALSVQYLRLLHNFCDRDCDNYSARRLLLSKEEREYIFSDANWQEEEQAFLQRNLEPGLFSKVLKAFCHESDDSPYRFWLASCSESYLRGSSPHEQWFAAKSGLLHHLVEDILSDRLHCAGSLQTSFDLLGEVCKGNAEVLHLLAVKLEDDDQFSKLFSKAASNLVDSNVFLRSLLLTMERIAAAKQFSSTVIRKQADPWIPHSYGPWTGRSGPNTRFYLTHSWWDALPMRSEKGDGTTQEEASDDARSTDWFPPILTRNNEQQNEVSGMADAQSLDSGVIGYNGWHFVPCNRTLTNETVWSNEAILLPNSIGRLAWFLVTNQSRLLRDLLCVVDLTNINHENICCLNTAVVVSIFAHRRKQLVSVLDELKKMTSDEEETAARSQFVTQQQNNPSSPEYMANNQRVDASRHNALLLRHSISARLGDRTHVLENFRELLWFWSEYYTHRGRDRLSLEFSSHVRFHEWHSVVTLLCEGERFLGDTSLRLPKSPYQRAARVVEHPIIPRRRSG